MAKLSGIEMDTSSIKATIIEMEAVEKGLREQLQIITDVAAKKMQAWGMQNARWTDRSGDARKGLKGQAYWEDDKNLVCAVMHQKDYGVWLELAHERKYAILEEAIEKYKDSLLNAYKKLVGEV